MQVYSTTTLAGAVDFADDLLADFGGAPEWALVPFEVAPLLVDVEYSSNTAGAAHQINIYLATAAGQFGTENMIRVVTVNASTTPSTANYARKGGGQGGCLFSFRVTGTTPMQLRITTVGKASTATVRVIATKGRLST